MRKMVSLFVALLLVSALSLTAIGCSDDAMVKPESKATVGKAASAPATPAAPAAEPAPAAPAAEAAPATPAAK